MPARARILVALAALALPAALVHGQSADRDKPVNWEGDSGGANLANKTGELSGHVVITQGTTVIRADRVQFKQNPDNSLSATAYGNPVTFRQKREGAEEYYEGSAQRAVYDGQKQFLELFDRAVLKRGTDEVRSNYISYNSATDIFKAEGRPDALPPGAGEVPLGSRVRGVFQPQSTDAKDAKDGAAKGGGKEAPKANPPLPLKSDDALSGAAPK